MSTFMKFISESEPCVALEVSPLSESDECISFFISEYSDYMTKSVEISKDDIRRLIKLLKEELENADN